MGPRMPRSQKRDLGHPAEAPGRFIFSGGGAFVPGYTRRMRGLSGCLVKLVLLGVAAAAFFWVVAVLMNPWALHIGGRATPLLFWHGSGSVRSKDGKTYPLYVTFFPGRPQKGHLITHREGKRVNADLRGTGWLCLSPGQVERLDLSGTMYGGYTDTANSLIDFRLLEWRKPFRINYQYRGFFDLAGTFQGPNLVMNRPNEQGLQFKAGLFIDNATATFHWASYDEFESACRAMGSAQGH
jgi:hypothetical protein